MSPYRRKDEKGLVLETYPAAFAHDDGQSVKIYEGRIVLEDPCEHCNHRRRVVLHDLSTRVLGAGPNEWDAWRDVLSQIEKNLRE